MSMLNMRFIWLIILVFIFSGCGKKTEVVVISPQEKYVKEHPELSEDTKKNILNETITIGMTEEQVMASWGKPDDIEIFSSEYNSYKRWIYKNRPKVYWTDGKVSQLLK